MTIMTSEKLDDSNTGNSALDGTWLGWWLEGILTNEDLPA